MIKIFTSFIGNDVPNVYPWAGNDGVRSCGIVATFNSSEENWKCSLGPGPTYSKSSSESYNMYTSVKLEHIMLTLFQPRGKGVTVTPPPILFWVNQMSVVIGLILLLESFFNFNKRNKRLTSFA